MVTEAIIRILGKLKLSEIVRDFRVQFRVSIGCQRLSGDHSRSTEHCSRSSYIHSDFFLIPEDSGRFLTVLDDF